MKKEEKDKPYLLDYRKYMANKVKDDPDFRHEYLMACLEEANDPELSEEELLAALTLAIKAVVDSYGSVDKFMAETKVNLSRKTIYNLVDGKPKKRGPSAITLFRIFNAVGLSVTAKKVS